jgi:antitoxin (DNA-binding transcriptional repressor) of toxin-antitoxin stability system
MAALIEEEGLDEDGHPVKHLIPRRRRQKRKRKQTKNTTQEDRDNDDEDGDFSSSGSGDESTSASDSNGSDSMIPNDEVCFALLLSISYSPGFLPRLLTCSLRKQGPVPNEPNQPPACNK